MIHTRRRATPPSRHSAAVASPVPLLRPAGIVGEPTVAPPRTVGTVAGPSTVLTRSVLVRVPVASVGEVGVEGDGRGADGDDEVVAAMSDRFRRLRYLLRHRRRMASRCERGPPPHQPSSPARLLPRHGEAGLLAGEVLSAFRPRCRPPRWMSTAATPSMKTAAGPCVAVG